MHHSLNWVSFFDIYLWLISTGFVYMVDAKKYFFKTKPKVPGAWFLFILSSHWFWIVSFQLPASSWPLLICHIAHEQVVWDLSHLISDIYSTGLYLQGDQWVFLELMEKTSYICCAFWLSCLHLHPPALNVFCSWITNVNHSRADVSS